MRVAILVVFSARLLCAQTVVTLAPLTAPATAQPAITVVSVVGSGFPPGAIPAANVTVTLTFGGRHGGTLTTQATAVQQVFGTTERVDFQAPGSLAPTEPVECRVSIAGMTASGAAFVSGNKAALTINPASKIVSLSPALGNAALSLQVMITGLYTNFVQGATQANFGAGVSVGGGPEGQPGPVTVISATRAVAQLAIDPAANAGSQAVTVITGLQQAPDSFTIGPAIPFVNIDMTTTSSITPGVSGFDDEFLTDAVEYWDPKYIAAVMPLKPGWLRFPGGTPSMGFDWQSGQLNGSWVKHLAPLVGQFPATAMLRAKLLTQAKGGAHLSDFAAFAQTMGAWPIICLNGYTDTNPGSANKMAMAAQANGLSVHEWELSNEPWEYPKVFPTSTDYAKSQYGPYYQGLISADPGAITGIAYQGQYSGGRGTWAAWDGGLAGYTPNYWNGVTLHVYPVVAGNLNTIQTQAALSGFLAHGTIEYLNSYVLPLIGENTPLFITEVNDGHSASENFKSYIFNGIYLAEFAARMSTASAVKAIGITNLYQGNTGNSGMLRAPDDFETYLIDQVMADPNYSTDTATNPNTQFSFYYSAPGLAMEIVNQAINSSTQIWPTTVTGGPTVPISGYDLQSVQAIYAQGYLGEDGTHYLLITNKSDETVPVAIEVSGNLLEQFLTTSYISSPNAAAENTAVAQTSVRIVNGSSANPITVGPYSVMRVQW